MTRIEKYGRKHYAVYDSQDHLLAVCAYKKGAHAVSSVINDLEQLQEMLITQVAQLQHELENRSHQLPLFRSSA